MATKKKSKGKQEITTEPKVPPRQNDPLLGDPPEEPMRMGITEPKAPPTPKPETMPCPDCNGRGFTERHYGLIQRKCDTCNGTGKVLV